MCLGFRATKRNSMRFEKLDLNLLVVLDALLKEKSVSRASELLNLSQSGTSAALSRLREFFEDELLTPSGRVMTLTPRAEELAGPVMEALGQIREKILTPDKFDAGTSQRTIKIAAIDVVVQVLLSKLVCSAAKEAPGICLDICALSDEPAVMLQRGHADIVISLDYLVAAEQSHEWLYNEDFVVIGCQENPHLTGEMTAQLFMQLGHVSVCVNRNQIGFDEMALRRLGIDRRVEAIAPSFVSVPRLLLGTQRIAVIHRRLANQVRATLPVTIFEMPFEFPLVREIAQWPRRHDNDKAIKWCIRRLKEISEQLES